MGLTRTRDLRSGQAIWASCGSWKVTGTRLRRSTRAEVVIVGAGISGALMAQSLAAAGKPPLIVGPSQASHSRIDCSQHGTAAIRTGPPTGRTASRHRSAQGEPGLESFPGSRERIALPYSRAGNRRHSVHAPFIVSGGQCARCKGPATRGCMQAEDWIAKRVSGPARTASSLRNQPGSGPAQPRKCRGQPGGAGSRLSASGHPRWCTVSRAA